MRKIIIAGWVSILLIFLLPLISSGNGVSERSEGDFSLTAVYTDLEAELPIIGLVRADMAILYMEWSGKQNKVVTPSGNHNHHAKVENAKGSITLLGVELSEPIPGIPNPVPVPVKIYMDIETATMNEHRTGDTITVDVFLRTKSATIQQVTMVVPPLEIPLIPEPIELGPGMIKIQDNQIKFLKLKAFPAPSIGRIRVTTLGKIKSGY